MARVTSVDEFEKRLRAVCKDSSSVMRTAVLSGSLRHKQFRIFLRDRTFVDVYYNQENGKTAFAQINNDARVFGADNTNGVWHWHPRENPAGHRESDTEITFEEFMKRLEEYQGNETDLGS